MPPSASARWIAYSATSVLPDAGGRGHEHRRPGVERVERTDLERIELDAELGLEGRARRGHGPVLPAVVLDVAAPVVLEVAAVLDDVAGAVVVVEEELTVDDGGVTTELDDEVRCWKIRSSTTVSARTPTTTAAATMISCRLRTGAPCASRRSGRRRLLISVPVAAHRLRILPMMIDAS